MLQEIVSLGRLVTSLDALPGLDDQVADFSEVIRLDFNAYVKKIIVNLSESTPVSVGKYSSSEKMLSLQDSTFELQKDFILQTLIQNTLRGQLP